MHKLYILHFVQNESLRILTCSLTTAQNGFQIFNIGKFSLKTQGI